MRVRWTRATPRASPAVAVVWMSVVVMTVAAAAAAVAAAVAVALPTAAMSTAALRAAATPVAAIPIAAAAAGVGPPLRPAVGRQAFDADAQAAMLDQLRSHGDALDASFLALCGILVFLMQTGFAMLTAGCVGGVALPRLPWRWLRGLEGGAWRVARERGGIGCLRWSVG